MSANQTPFILGLDIGTNSIGWALLNLKGKKPVGLLDAGVRIFQAGLEDMELTGKGIPPNTARREARQRRRTLERRNRRLSKLFSILQNAGMLPNEDPVGETQEEMDLTRKARRNRRSQVRHDILNKLDKEICKSHLKNEEEAKLLLPVLPYWLRSRALDVRCEPYELGRALYNLAQRRGFKSNRKTAGRDKEEGQVKRAISELQKNMEESGTRTLGEYFTKINPHNARIRKRWTSRKMYEDEFECIWEAQKCHHQELRSDDLKRQIFQAIFFQRPLKSQKQYIGYCELEKGRRRAPWILLLAQQCRLLQRVNDLEVIPPGEKQRPLNKDEREELTMALERNGDMTFAKIRQLLGMNRTYRFNLQAGGEKKLPGNHTSSKLYEIFGDRWEKFSKDERDQIIEDVWSIQNDEALKRRGMTAYGLDEEAAEKFSEFETESGYCSFSRQALGKLVPLLAKGKHLQAAIKEIYSETLEPETPIDRLPPVFDILPELRNPVVTRSLTELRKVVNAIIRKYGKPTLIRTELARSLKQSAKSREQYWKRNRQNEKAREKAARRIVAERDIQNPTRDDILRVLLADECTWICPYTGKSFNMAQLFEGHIEIEHIIPFARSLDNTYMNKTLCLADENRNIKKNRTPYEAYGSNNERWENILGRVKNFKGDAKDRKYELFMMDDEQVAKILDSFTGRHLIDTAYATKLSVKYLGKLYGSDIDAKGKRRIQGNSGMAVAFLRAEWGLNAILGNKKRKSRNDHRHHAIDAIVSALLSPTMIKGLSNAATHAQAERRRLFGQIDQPWDTFIGDVGDTLKTLNISHHVSRKIQGPFHEETNYSPPRIADGNISDEGDYVHIRKPLEALSKKMIDQIVDPVIKNNVKEKLAENDGNPKKVFSNPENHPMILCRNGMKMPIHKVRIRVKMKPSNVGKGFRTRYVKTGSNHHIEVFEETDSRGKIKWGGEIISRYEAMRRLKAGEPVICRNHGPNRRFLFSLSGGDIIKIDRNSKVLGLCVVRTISTHQGGGYLRANYVSINDARKKKEIIEEHEWEEKSLESLRKSGCTKMNIDPLGNVIQAND
ncbi:type II CRISPR RNA-guided endonuclease Cas9 [Thermodesulfobacteriota bacterium]